MKAKLSRKLSQLQNFRSPRVELEQYMTPAALAADIIHTAYMQEDIEGRKVVDLGTGTGVLAIGAALSGAGEVVAVEKDREALEIARKNAAELGVEKDIEFVEEDVREHSGEYDTCVMNPPFSVHSELGEDFFRKAFSIASHVYSLAPREQGIKDFAGEYQHEVLAVEPYTVELPATYGFHTQERRKTDMDFIITRRTEDGT